MSQRLASPFLDAELFAAPAFEPIAPLVGPDIVAWTDEYDEEGARADEEPEAPPHDAEDSAGGSSTVLMRVPDTTKPPFCWVCSIAVQREVTVASGRTEQRGLAPAGTGVLISPRHVLTAAHVLRSVEKDSSGQITERYEPRVIEVSPGRDGGDHLFGKVGVKRWDSHPRWKPEEFGSVFDYALITLAEAVGERSFKSLSGRPLGWWGKEIDDTALPQMPLATLDRLMGSRGLSAGYPHSAEHFMWCGGAALSTIEPAEGANLQRSRNLGAWLRAPRLLALPLAAEKGQSGSPVWVRDGSKRYLVGVLSSKVVGQSPRAVVVNAGVVAQLAELAKKDSPRGTAFTSTWFTAEAPPEVEEEALPLPVAGEFEDEQDEKDEQSERDEQNEPLPAEAGAASGEGPEFEEEELDASQFLEPVATDTQESPAEEAAAEQPTP